MKKKEKKKKKKNKRRTIFFSFSVVSSQWDDLFSLAHASSWVI